MKPQPLICTLSCPKTHHRPRLLLTPSSLLLRTSQAVPARLMLRMDFASDHACLFLCLTFSDHLTDSAYLLSVLAALKLMFIKDVVTRTGRGSRRKVEAVQPAAVAPVHGDRRIRPRQKRIKVLGLPLWIWMVVPALYIVSYRYISLLGECTVKKLSLTMIEDKYDVVYYLDGLGRSGYNLIVCVVILLAWELYFRSPRNGLRRYRVSEKALDIGTWTAVSLLVGAFLVLVKNALILSWESHAIYSRIAGNIRKVGLQLYFLGLAHDLNVDIFSPDKGIPKKADNITNSDTDEENSDTDEENSATEELPTYRKKHMAQCFIKVTKLCSRNYDPIPNKIRKRWRKFKKDDSDYITEESMRENLQDHKIPVNDMEINGWFKQLRDADKLKFNSDSSSTGEIDYSTFEGWMAQERHLILNSTGPQLLETSQPRTASSQTLQFLYSSSAFQHSPLETNDALAHCVPMMTNRHDPDHRKTEALPDQTFKSSRCQVVGSTRP
ncbi:hypothetical protein Nepgr_023862 [Nepenthes gracilis]|uniref:Uncharacterized protein n=1 Tax=Nepenthes gracilis TaxID=150966 RepID=A0AAD3XZH4_NEPGR|nr:hypothetical protein Nepgr_023862 [Nepenthes gracilis]